MRNGASSGGAADLPVGPVRPHRGGELHGAHRPGPKQGEEVEVRA